MNMATWLRFRGYFLIRDVHCALASLGKREEAVKIFQQTAAIFLATRQERMARMTVELCKEHYDIDVELYL